MSIVRCLRLLITFLLWLKSLVGSGRTTKRFVMKLRSSERRMVVASVKASISRTDPTVHGRMELDSHADTTVA